MKSAASVYVAITLASAAWSQTPPQNVKSPEISANGRITFRLWAPHAQKVSIPHLTAFASTGTMLELSKDDQGIWSLTTSPMEPDIYPYRFIVDGVNIPDPANPLAATGIAGGPFSMVHVPGPASVSWEVSNVPHGNVVHQFYHSDLIGDDRDFYVYTPPLYDPASKTEYPVLYLLHGLGADASGWTQLGCNFILDNLIAQSKAKRMIIVSPLGYGFANPAKGITGRTADRKKEFDTLTASILNEVIPIVEKMYRVAKDRDSRAIAGFSSGGAQSFYIGLNHIDKFAYVAGFSNALLTYPSALFGEGPRALPPGQKYPPLNPGVFADVFPSLDAKSASQLRLLWISCGTEDRLIGHNQQFRDWLQANNVQFKYVATSGEHTPMVWRRNLIELAPLLFQAKK
jgi:enterochelin esterase-like enzyme